jgi:hypothetical protein
MSMGCVRGEHDTVFRRMNFIEGPCPFQKVKIQPFRTAQRCVCSHAPVVHDDALQNAQNADAARDVEPDNRISARL